MHKHYKNDKLVFSFEDIGNAVNLYINGDNKHSIRENLRDIYDDYCKSKGQDFNHDEYGYAIHEAVDRLEYGHGVYLKLDNDKFNPAELFGNATEEQLYEALLKNEFLHEGEHNFTDYEYIVRANLSADKCGRNIKVRDFAAFDSYGDFSEFKADEIILLCDAIKDYRDSFTNEYSFVDVVHKLDINYIAFNTSKEEKINIFENRENAYMDYNELKELYENKLNEDVKYDMNDKDI